MESAQSHPTSLTFNLPSERASEMLMADLGLLLASGDVVALHGDLGSGKTTLARALIRYLANDVTLDVPSPTFTLVQPYELPAFTILHADLYRIGDAREVEELDLFDQPRTLLLLEWPERAGAMLPDDRIDITITHNIAQGDTARRVTLSGHGHASARIKRLAALTHFLARAGFDRASRAYMAGDASSRSYARLTRNDGVALLMNAPRRPDGPPVRDGKPYSAIAHLAEDVIPFVALARGLREHGYSAPDIYSSDLEHGFLLLEDLGGELFVEGDPPRPIQDRYAAAAEMLAALHRETLPASIPVDTNHTYAIPPYDAGAFAIELDLLLEWYLPDHHTTLTSTQIADFHQLWDAALERSLQGQMTWVLRDVHSPNLIWLPERPDTARVGLIDFQDATIGPPAYDVASLLQDARIDVPEDMEIALFSHYVAARRANDAAFDAAAFSAAYATMAAQRATKILGIFARLNKRDGKPHYLRHQPRVWGYLNRALAHPALAQLQDWYVANVPPPSSI